MVGAGARSSPAFLAVGGVCPAVLFTWARVADEYLDVFDEVLGEMAR